MDWEDELLELPIQIHNTGMVISHCLGLQWALASDYSDNLSYQYSFPRL